MSDPKPSRTRRPIRPKDFTQNAKRMVDIAAGLAEERYPPDESPQKRKKPPERRSER